MSSNAHNAGFKFLRGEGDLSPSRKLTLRCSWRGDGEKFSVDSDRAWLRGTIVTSGRWVVLFLFRVLKLFPSLGTNVVKHYTTMGVHRSFPHGVVSLVILRDCYPMNVRLK